MNFMGTGRKYRDLIDGRVDFTGANNRVDRNDIYIEELGKEITALEEKKLKVAADTEAMRRWLHDVRDRMLLRIRKKLLDLTMMKANSLKEIDAEIRAVKDEIKDVMRDQKRFFEPHNFRLTSKKRIYHPDECFVIREGYMRQVRNRVARYWCEWEQIDDDGNHITSWSGPVAKKDCIVPEFIRPGFIGYIIHCNEHFTPPPPWFKCEMHGDPMQYDIETGEMVPLFGR